MSARQLIARLRSLGVGIAASGGRLRVTAAKGELTDQIKQAILTQKGELLDLLAEEAGGCSNDLIAIPRNGPLPLSSFQQRLWVLHRLEPDDTAYNIVTVWPGAGPMDAARVECAIRTVVRDNEILRATFRDDGAAPGLHLLPPEAARIVIRDLRGQSGVEQEAIIRADVAVATKTPFDLGTEVPVRWAVYQLADDRIATLVAAHHIALEEWSLSLLRRKVEMACTSEATAVVPTPLQYVDFAAWQGRTQNQTTLAAELAWWERNLADLPQLCSFPADRPAMTDGSAFTRPFCWNAELVSGLRSLVRRGGATVYMALLAVCATVLHAHTGQDDIALGSPMGMRERPEFETMLGPFVNLLVLRLDLSNDPTFFELLVRARDAVLDAHDHRQVPFETLVERLSPVRSFERPPLFQVSVVLHNASDEPAALIYSGGAVQDLTWYAREIEGRIEGSLEFRADLYTPDTIDRVVTHLEMVLRHAVRDPGAKISQISLLTAAEREQVLTQFNATVRELDRTSFTRQFERQAVLRADAPAIRFDGAGFTYGDLNRRANQLARYLISQGIGGGSLVGICLDRSLSMVVTLLGVQKAGAAYVPLDPGFPVERLNFMLADSRIAALITSEEAAARLDIPADVRVIDLVAEAAACLEMDTSNLALTSSPEDIAYVIYTSGSTGCPNGVAVSHGGLSNFLGAMRCAPGLAATDVVAAVTTVSFDIAALELYLPLTIGARVEIVSRETAADGIALEQLLAATEATVLQATPATWRLLMEAGWQGREGFRALCGGEGLPRDLADAVLKTAKELWNLYGPTETTIWSTAERVEVGTATISIGRPIANTFIYVLDAAGQPAAIGIPGEIWIGGEGVATGYHRRPELTAARFAIDPFSSKPGARMYRTGDVGRWGADGRLFHMGRVDRQVKLRGFRIEPGEIEAVLAAHPAVAQAVVTARDVVGDNPKLVAYIVYHPAEDLTASEIRTHLRQTLPEYMVPSLFIALDALPMTPNGKVDHRALPDLFKSAASLAGRYEAPTPGLEQLIAEIWKDLLHVERVGAHDNFFELGGHSLLALRVTAAIEKQTGCRIQPRILFLQSLRQVAAAVRREQTSQMLGR